MADIPTGGMKETAQQVIETLGESMDFQRRDGAGEWQAASLDVTVHRQAVGSTLKRDPGGIGLDEEYSCFAPGDANILPGDRAVLDGIWYLVRRLQNRGTHLEFVLEKTVETVS